MNRIRYFDSETVKVVRIPASELLSGAVFTRVEGIEGEVWTQPSTGGQPVNDQQAVNGEQNGYKHPPFNESVRIYIEQIQAAFAEHYPLSFEEWEDGFRRDENASQQIAVWWYAADIYKAFAANETCEHRRADVYRCIFNCMIASQESFWDVYHPSTISCSEAQRIVDRYFMIKPLSDPTKTDGADGHA